MDTNRAACPKCGAADPKPLSFTWWGGALCPKILHHVKCIGCGYKYNGKTGRDNTTGIVIYFVIVGIISFVLMLVMIAFFFKL